ncbi:peptidylprolyl isomerase [Sphingomonas bacterium]|uniref:peptidylprolyl isomerase n=1 Tax=Sphingomonas bacterium TaxID=1895847 RepID=UPI001576846F|nr:peptidylprolyl isomerase [Sphingomonas bacterium]
MISTLLAAALQAAPIAAHAPLPGDAIAADWRPIPDDELMVMTLAGGRTVVIRLAPRYAPEHVANVRRLALAHYWDATAVYRVQDNWVTQWGGQPADPPNDAGNKPLSAGVVPAPAAEYDLASSFLPAQRLSSDAYASETGITADGWAIAGQELISRSAPAPAPAAAWLTHCYGTVGVARGAAPDTGSGSELFMPIGGSARRLDHNYTIVGRVIEGARYLSGLPRSDAPMGMYATAAEQTAIVSVRLASDLPAATRPRFEYRAADNPRYAAMLAARQHPAGMVAPGGIDVCDVPLATRRTAS